MAELSTTLNLNVPRLLGSHHVMRDKINDAIDRIDTAALPIKHADTKAHFALWQPDTAYKKQDVVRTPTCPNWGFYMCTTAGTSGTVEPVGYGDGDIVDDGTAVWVLKKFGGGAGSAAIDYWRNGVIYEKGTLVIYNRLLYRCASEHKSASTFDAARWTLINVGYLPDWETGQIYDAKMLVVSDGVLYRCANYHTAFDFIAEKDQWEIVAGKGARIADWQPGVDYLQFETVFVDGSLYRAKAAHIAGLDFAADAVGWELLSNRKIVIEDWKTGEKYEVGECTIKNGHMYRAKVAHTAAIFANDVVNWELIDLSYLADWAALTPYKAQEMVLYQGFIYRAKTVHTSGIDFAADFWELLAKGYLEAWQSGAPYIEGDAAIYAGHLLRCSTGHTSSVNFVDDLIKWEVLNGGVAEWRVGAFYFVGDLVTKEGLLYCCTMAHAGSSMDSTKFKQLTIGYLPKWQTGASYILCQTVTYENKVLRCIMPHKARIVFDAKEAEYWEIVARTKILVVDWQVDSDYEEKEIVIQDGKIYRCTKAHNSSDKFKQIYWEILSGADANEIKQIMKTGVIAPLSIEVPINYTTKFRLSPVEILKYNPSGGDADQLIAVEAFDNADADDFIVGGKSAELSEAFIFDGVAKINTVYKVKVDAPRDMGGDTLCETEYIDFSAYKKIEYIRGGFL